MIRVGIVVLVVAVALGCGRGGGTKAATVELYLQRAKGWAPVEAETARTMERILETEFVDEAEVRRQITDARPRLQAHLAQIHGFESEDPVIGRIHDSYVDGWEKLLAGFDAIERGFDTGDYTLLARGREGMAAWRETMLRVAGELRALIRSFGLDPQGAVES